MITVEGYNNTKKGRPQCPFCFEGTIVQGVRSRAFWCDRCYKNVDVRQVENN